MRVEFLWFQDCPNHESARVLLKSVLAAAGAQADIVEIDASDPARAEEVHFPGSPTIRIDGKDIEPGFTDPGDYWPRCRLYRTNEGLSGLPPREWLEAAVAAAMAR